ncbi:MAG: glycoside hydrolase family 20 zincin-like fold domain-containing protein [Thermoguttaceae bacterium]
MKSLRRNLLAPLLTALMVSSLAPGSEPAVQPVASPDGWLNRLIPLPKQVSIARQITLPATEVKITLAGTGGPLEQNALGKLRSLFLEKAGTEAGAGTEADAGSRFEILLGLCDAQGRVGPVALADASRLGELPNSDQAYLIRPDGDGRIVLAALDPKGLFYAALTMRQLLENGFREDEVTVPLAEVTDWPDLAERGLWGGSSTRDLEWMADRKMNLVEFHTTHQVDPSGKPVTAISRSLLDRGLRSAVKMVPIISHLNGMGERGVYEAYPELRGKGDKALYKDGDTELWAPCPSSPKLHEILAGWMRGYAASGVRDISCWLGELTQRCQCDECSKTGQFALETRAFVKAWRLARQDYPDLRIRILTTQGSYDTNDRVLAECPAEVAVTYYDGGRTYDSSRDPMIYPLMEQFAAGGRILGCYPQLTPSWRIVSPWSCPQFVKARMTELVDKKASSLCGYVVPDNRLFDFNVTAAAEWSWNAHGRDERQFALAWARRQGFGRPDAVADWVVLLGPVSWDLYGARLVERYFFRPAALERMLAARKRPTFGEGLFRYLPDAEALERNLEVCREAGDLAERCGSPAIKAETQAVATYYQMLDQLCRICDLLAENKTFDAAGRKALQTRMNAFALAGALNTEALADWERSVGVGAGSTRFRDGLEATDQTVAAVARALEPFGVRNPAPLLAGRTVGQWESEDFRQRAEVEKTFDVTDLLAGPGVYRVTLQYTSGWNGAATRRAALVALDLRDRGPGSEGATSSPAGGTHGEVAVDEHPGNTGNESRDNVYSLRLDRFDPALRYRLVVRLQGTRPQDQQPGRTGCSGQITLERRRDPDWQVQLLSVEPRTD